jgi:spore coat protein CotH
MTFFPPFPEDAVRRFRAPLALALGLVVATALGAAVLERPGQAARRAQNLTADELFQISKAWPVHLTMTREAWEALVPVPQPARGMFMGSGFSAPEGLRNGISGQRGLDFEYVHGTFEIDGRRFDDVAIRFKGNGTYPHGQKFNKPSLKIDLNKFVKGQKLAGMSTINLHSNIIDGSLMNEELAYRLYRDAGSPAPRTTYARVSITVPGLYKQTYFGLYGLVENVDTNFTQARYGVSDGAILKPVTTAPFTDVGKTWASYNQMYDPKTDLTETEKQRVIDFCHFVSHATDQVFNTRLAEYVDIDAFAKYMALVVWLANPDTILQQGQNYYVHMHPKTKTLAFIPWDQDHSFGQFAPFRTHESQQQLNILRPWTESPMGGSNRLLQRVFAHEPFRRRYLAELLTLTKTVAQPDRLVRQVDELGAAIAPIVKDEPNAVRVATFTQALGEEPFGRPNNPMVIVLPIKVFVRARHASVVAQLQALGLQ